MKHLVYNRSTKTFSEVKSFAIHKFKTVGIVNGQPMYLDSEASKDSEANKIFKEKYPGAKYVHSVNHDKYGDGGTDYWLKTHLRRLEREGKLPDTSFKSYYALIVYETGSGLEGAKKVGLIDSPKKEKELRSQSEKMISEGTKNRIEVSDSKEGLDKLYQDIRNTGRKFRY